MDFNAILQAVSSVGFPIVACGVLFYQNNKLTETITNLKETIADNTTAIKILLNEIDRRDKR
jgi:hypothetical protein